MINNRQKELLKKIVEAYIQTAKPVSSKALCITMHCSSATIRNEMSLLEELGLLEKTHISSGRIPSEKGYRFYVDTIMKPKELTGEDMLKLQTIFHNQSLVLTDVIRKSMEIVSELTNYTAIVLGSSSKNNKISKVEVVPIKENEVIAIVITDMGHVEHKNVLLEEKISVLEVKQTVDLINKLIIGTPIEDVQSKLEFEVKPKIGDNIKNQRVIYDALYNFFNEFAAESNFKIHKPSNMLMEPEFNDVNKIRSIISKFDDKEFINSIKEEENGINIYIGSENEFDNDVTVIKTKFSVDGEDGTLALIGPKRMDYDRVLTLLQFIKDNIKNKND